VNSKTDAVLSNETNENLVRSNNLRNVPSEQLATTTSQQQSFRRCRSCLQLAQLCSCLEEKEGRQGQGSSTLSLRHDKLSEEKQNEKNGEKNSREAVSSPLSATEQTRVREIDEETPAEIGEDAALPWHEDHPGRTS
jgi:hypothetical protein